MTDHQDQLGEPIGAPATSRAFGTTLRALRQQHALTLAALAERAQTTKSYLSQIETGHKPPPARALIDRLEQILDVQPGHLAHLADWHHTPTPVRRNLARLQSTQRAITRLLSSLQADGLDAAHASGELQRLVERLDSQSQSSPETNLASLLPTEVPLINSVTAGYPADFTDLDFPARVADEYVRCPDLADPDAFAARVVGDSMEPDYRQGDVVVFSPAAPIESGSDCFVRLEPDHETTFKRIYFEQQADGSESIRIQPINNRYPPTTVPREQVAGLYRAVQLMRPVG